MIVYLDQNKWIDLARIENGRDASERALSLKNQLSSAMRNGCVFPLSAIHVVEFSRIKNDQRRRRLGKVMWKFSRGVTTAPLKEIICWELEIAFAKAGYEVKPRTFNYLGNGICHAFGEKRQSPIAAALADEIDEAMLCGTENLPPIQGARSKQQEYFANHLRRLNERKHELEKERWDDWLYALSMADITEPLYEVMSANKIPHADIETWGKEGIKYFLDSIPTRRLDIHLHRQVLKNSQYKPKPTDLEDWAGLGPAMCYADVVVCEKHFADLVSRDRFSAKARIETSIYDIFPEIGSV
ncbi:hypothetical protein H0Z60_20825 [Ectothiorhodospiraceae bacterium WFHF3C12]|nr:hypothetical protein [Ectothiorhodospiraceae bacterium WFHF3C12]